MNVEDVMNEIWPSSSMMKEEVEIIAELNDWDYYDIVKKEDINAIEKLLLSSNDSVKLTLLNVAIQMDKMKLVKLITQSHKFDKAVFHQLMKNSINNREVKVIKFMLDEDLFKYDDEMLNYFHHDLNNWGDNDKEMHSLFTLLKRKAKIQNLEM